MPTLSREEQQIRNERANTAINDFKGTGYQLAMKLKVNSAHVYAAKKTHGCCPDILWKALIKADMVQPIPREQKSFMVPIGNEALAIDKMREWYPHLVIMKEWVQG